MIGKVLGRCIQKNVTGEQRFNTADGLIFITSAVAVVEFMWFTVTVCNALRSQKLQISNMGKSYPLKYVIL